MKGEEEGSHAWWPMEGEGEVPHAWWEFSPLFISPPTNNTQTFIFSFDLKLLLYHGFFFLILKILPISKKIKSQLPLANIGRYLCISSLLLDL